MIPLQIIDCAQGSDEWIKARCGVVTASEFKNVMATSEGKMRRKYLLTVVGERYRGAPFERYTNGDMERGHALEDEARRAYSFVTDNEVTQIGFMRRGDVGYSPDGLIGNDGLQEIKTKLDHLHIECLLNDAVPAEHEKQLQGGLWVSGRSWIDFVSYSPGLPLFVKRIERNEALIARIKVDVEEFCDEVNRMVAQLAPRKAA